ncbi:hypothetical protein ASF10_14155 [Flavobacterium sp. Leaf82]|uniref:hypothetical protein n=1 Tax=Flavobacterium sp. Leaf82 TaxID=1736238 RepID=UPI0006F2885D|nr:hypothetical protein [Flavobacterium sp. Leaf82]KQO21258.1 hypothetical protein ASF10_14155 [Flavobacterium sp. Leaf82]
MYCNILTQKEHPKYWAVKKMTKLLLEFVEADCIYFSESDLESKIGIMTVVISRESLHYYDDVNDHLWKVIQNHNEFVFCFFNRDCIKDELKRGNLFFVFHCKETELIYKNSGQKTVLDIGNIKMKRLLKQTGKRYSMWRSEASTIGRDFKYHHKNNNHLMALYVLHQQFRYMFINASWFITGEWIPHENLSDQQEHIGAFNASLGKVFDSGNQKEKEVLEKIELARKAVQWGEEADSFDAETVDYANEKLQWIKNVIQEIFQEQRKKIKEIFKDYGN